VHAPAVCQSGASGFRGKIAVVEVCNATVHLVSSINDDSTCAGCVLSAPAQIFHQRDRRRARRPRHIEGSAAEYFTLASNSSRIRV